MTVLESLRTPSDLRSLDRSQLLLLSHASTALSYADGLAKADALTAGALAEAVLTEVHLSGLLGAAATELVSAESA